MLDDTTIIMDVMQRQASTEPTQTSHGQVQLLTPKPRVLDRSHSAAAPPETAAVAAGRPETSSGPVNEWVVVETKQMKQAKARRLQAEAAAQLAAASLVAAAAATRIQAVVRGHCTRARQPVEPEPGAEPEPEPEPPAPLGAVGAFEVLEAAPSDHHYLGEPAPAGKESKQLMRRAAEEWQMMQNGLPEGATVQVFEDRMDLLRCFVEGARL